MYLFSSSHNLPHLILTLLPLQHIIMTASTLLPLLTAQDFPCWHILLYTAYCARFTATNRSHFFSTNTLSHRHTLSPSLKKQTRIMRACFFSSSSWLCILSYIWNAITAIKMISATTVSSPFVLYCPILCSYL